MTDKAPRRRTVTLTDRIADVLRQYFDNAYDYEGNEFHPDISCLADDIAAVVRPRIDSIEQLDALPHGALVIRKYTSAAGWRLSELWEHRGESWYCLAAPLTLPGESWGIPAFPVQLLYTPGDTDD